MPASESFISDETVDHSSHYEFSFKKYHLPHSFEVAFIDKFYPNALSQFPFTRHSQTNQNEVSLDADVSENIFPFESQSINSFSGIDISQGVD